MTLNILGSIYKVIFWEDYNKMNTELAKDDKLWDCFNTKQPRELGSLGYCSYDNREIHVYIGELIAEEGLKDTLLHEICHAFLYEIGNSNYSDEDLVEKLAKWIPKINNIFNQGKELLEDVRNKNKQGC